MFHVYNYLPHQLPAAGRKIFAGDDRSQPDRTDICAIVIKRRPYCTARRQPARLLAWPAQVFAKLPNIHIIFRSQPELFSQKIARKFAVTKKNAIFALAF